MHVRDATKPNHCCRHMKMEAFVDSQVNKPLVFQATFIHMLAKVYRFVDVDKFRSYAIYASGPAVYT